MSLASRLTLDLRPSLEVRLEAAKALYVECFDQQYADSRSPSKPPNFNRWADLAYRADLVIYGAPDPDVPPHGHHPTPAKLTAFYVFEFLREHGIDGWALVQA